MNTEQIATALRARLVEVQADIARLEEATTQAITPDRDDMAGEIEEMATNESLEHQHIHEAEQIMAALNRIEHGTYGTCDVCGGAIAPARLVALPTATRCISCAA